MVSPRHVLAALAVLLLGSACERVKSLGTGGESELEKQRQKAAEQQRLEEQARQQMAERAKEQADREEELERKQLSAAVVGTLDKIAKLNVEIDHQARDPANAADPRARHLTEVHLASLQQIPLQDCPDDFAEVAKDFVYSVRAFSEYAYTLDAAEIEYVFEILSKGPEAARIASKNLKPGPQKLVERYVALADAAARYGAVLDAKGARLSPAETARQKAAPPGSPKAMD